MAFVAAPTMPQGAGVISECVCHGRPPLFTETGSTSLIMSQPRAASRRYPRMPTSSTRKSCGGMRPATRVSATAQGGERGAKPENRSSEIETRRRAAEQIRRGMLATDIESRVTGRDINGVGASKLAQGPGEASGEALRKGTRGGSDKWDAFVDGAFRARQNDPAGRADDVPQEDSTVSVVSSILNGREGVRNEVRMMTRPEEFVQALDNADREARERGEGGTTTPAAGEEPLRRTYEDCVVRLVELSKWREAVDALARMREARLIPEPSIVLAVMSACRDGGRWREAVELLRSLERDGAVLGGSAYETAMSACLKAFQSDTALSLFAEASSAEMAPEDSLGCYRLALRAHGAKGDWGRASEVLESMRKSGVAPDYACYRCEALNSRLRRLSAYRATGTGVGCLFAKLL